MKRLWEDSYGGCVFGNLFDVPGGAKYMPMALEAVTGWQNFGLDEALTIGKRVITLERIFNMKRGLTIDSDLDIGPRLLDKPPDGRGAGHSIAPHLKDLIKQYYECMGWDKETGKPTRETLEQLDLLTEGEGL